MLRLLKQRVGGNERGMALIMVITIGSVLMILATVAVTASISGTMKARQDQASNSALSAAYAGIEEYQSRLSNDSFYVQYGDENAEFSSASDLELPMGAQENPAFGIEETGTWATVSGSDGNAKYRYEVNTEEYLDSGVIRVRSTGLVNGVTRSIIADLRQTGFIDFLYFTDYEVSDPDISSNKTSCVKYEWAGRDSDCTRIRFGKSDIINGPMHSNDTLYICEAEFNGNVTTTNSKDKGGGRLYDIASGCGAPHFNSGAPAYSNSIGMPTTNSDMKRETRTDLTTAGVPRPGCLYTGPTRIVFNANGTMTVRSPWTKKTQIVGDPASGGSEPSECGSPSALRSASGATITVPERNMVYVQNVPTVANPNYWDKYESGRPSCASKSNPIGYPISKESVDSAAYGCTNGDVFVEGTMHGRLTIAAENYIYITGNLTYKDENDDVLGLVGNNAVWVWNPMDSSENALLTDTDREIDAAIISLLHTFQVQNHEYAGHRGILTIKGAIAQKFRGPVGVLYTRSNGTTYKTGYDKNYNYDPRFKYTAPPKFLSPVTTTYGVTTWMDTPAVMNADGSYR